MIVVPGTASQVLAHRVAELLGAELAGVTCRRFPDGELYLRVEGDFRGEECVVVQSTPPPQDRNIFELLALLETLRDAGAAELTAAVPYLAYGRQDRAFKPGEAVTSRVLAKHVSLNADRFIGVNLHKRSILDYFDVEAVELDASPLLGRYFRQRLKGRRAVIAPDAGASGMAEKVAEVLGCEHDHLEKKRLGPGEVVLQQKELDVEGVQVVLVDDIIDSGGSMVEAMKAIESQGAESVHVSCVHALATGSAIARLLAGGASEVAGTDTIASQVSVISVAEMLASVLK